MADENVIDGRFVLTKRGMGTKMKIEPYIGKIDKKSVLEKLEKEGLLALVYGCILFLDLGSWSFFSFLQIMCLTVSGMLVWVSTYQIRIQKKKRSIVWLSVAVGLILFSEKFPAGMFDGFVGLFGIVYILLVFVLQKYYQKRKGWMCKLYGLLRFPIVLIEAGSVPIIMGITLCIIGVIGALTNPLGWVCLAVVIVLILWKKKKRNDGEKIVEMATIVAGLHDFYISAPFSKNVYASEIGKYLSKENGIYSWHAVCDKKMDLDTTTVVFYYKPYYLMNIVEEEREKVIEKIREWFLKMREAGKEIIVLCEQNNYEQKAMQEWDELTQVLFHEYAKLFFTGLNEEEEWRDKKHVCKKCEFGMYNLKIPDVPKYRYLISQIKECNEASDNVEKFYGAIKIVEYIFQYRGLYVAGTQASKIKTDELSFSMGGWNNLQKLLEDKNNRKYETPEFMQAAACIDKVLLSKRPGKKNYKEISDVLVQLRNKYIGHGTMAYSVSEELLEAVYQFVYCVIEVFLQDGIYLEARRELIDDRFCNGHKVYCMLHRNQTDYLLSYFEIEEEVMADYIDFVSGDILTEGRRIIYKLSLNGEAKTNE